MTTSPEWMVYAQTLFALLFVIGLIFLTAALAKRMGLDKRFAGHASGTRRLRLVETLYLDTKHRLVIVDADGKEHLLLLGINGNVLVGALDAKDSDAA